MIDSVIKSLLDPISFSFLLGCLCGLLYFRLRNKKWTKRIAIFAIAWSVVWTQPYFVELLLYPLEFQLPASVAKQQQHKASEAKYIHVLACYYDGRQYRPFLSRWEGCSHQRMLHAYILHRKHQLPIVVTGGETPKGTNASHASFAQKYLLDLGVARSDLILLEAGTDSASEISAVASQLKPKNMLVVTSATHVYRVDRIYAEHEINAIISPIDHISSGALNPRLTFPRGYAAENTRRAFYEYLAIVKFWLT